VGKCQALSTQPESRDPRALAYTQPKGGESAKMPGAGVGR
jgi:hypothetical protein